MIYGYMRPLYNDSKCEKQYKVLNELCDKIYTEEHGSAKKRVQLDALFMELQPEDVVIVERLIVLADTSRHLMDLLKVCEVDQVIMHFLHENIKSNEVLSFYLKDIMMHMLQFQTDMIKQSTVLGMEEAKKQGKSVGRPKKLDDNIKKAISMYHEGYKLLEIKNETGISKSTLYRYLESTDIEQ
ncbi:recombinase family protein [Lysinibacillus sphaericus]|uniref:recombinase family protein n=1 Tax=Lysinibacillus sphaericus TaxID=1421 RepID=UPI000C17D911|nr:recombinase family protein [Lysinibacillus sphaericus]PIJ98138.1 resolvase [Lysinibacillus sphaericus]